MILTSFLLGSDITVTIGKNSAYLASSIFTVFFVLLPFSALTYFKFYDTLIPSSSPLIPFDISKNHTSNVIEIPKLAQDNIYHFDPLLEYNVDINLELACQHNTKDSFFKVPYQILLETHQIKDPKNPAITIDGFRTETFHSSFMIDCDTRYSHKRNNWLIPYNLRFWTPPILVNLNRFVSINLNKLTIKGKHLAEDVNRIQLKLEIGPNTSHGLISDDDKSSLQFQIKFVGFRYYLVKYFYSFYVIGVLIFWAISSFFTLAVSYSMLLTNQEKPSDETPTIRRTRVDQ